MRPTARRRLAQGLEQLRVPEEGRRRLPRGGLAPVPGGRRIRGERHGGGGRAPARMGDVHRHRRPGRPRAGRRRQGLGPGVDRQAGLHRPEMPGARLLLPRLGPAGGRGRRPGRDQPFDARPPGGLDARPSRGARDRRRRGARTGRQGDQPADRRAVLRRRVLPGQAPAPRIDRGDRTGGGGPGARRRPRRPRRGAPDEPARRADRRAPSPSGGAPAGPGGRERAWRGGRGLRGGQERGPQPGRLHGRRGGPASLRRGGGGPDGSVDRPGPRGAQPPASRSAGRLLLAGRLPLRRPSGRAHLGDLEDRRELRPRRRSGRFLLPEPGAVVGPGRRLALRPLPAGDPLRPRGPAPSGPRRHRRRTPRRDARPHTGQPRRRLGSLHVQEGG